MATVYKTDGTSQEVQPENGKDFKLEELYKLVECQTIELVTLGGGKIMIIDEEGKLSSPPKPLNAAATQLFKQLPRIPGDYIAGNALVCLTKEVK